MVEQSLAQPARPVPATEDLEHVSEIVPRALRPAYRVEEIAAKAEAELERLRAARPALASRIDRAGSIVCRQLGSLNGYRPIRIVLHPDGVHTYRVLSDGKLGRSYTVNPHGWSCGCPDHVRRQAACKHALACWVLERVYKAPARRKRGYVSGQSRPTDSEIYARRREAVEPECPIGHSESLRNAVPLSAAIEGLGRMGA